MSNDTTRAALAQAAQQEPVAQPSPTAGMNIAQRILHVGGRNNEAGYVEFGSIQAVEALIRQVLRDMPAALARAEPKALTHAQAVALLDEWADASCTRFSTRSYTTITTEPVSRDDLLQLIHAANHVLTKGDTA